MLLGPVRQASGMRMVRSSHYRVHPRPDSSLPSGASLIAIERWDVGHYRGRRHSQRLSVEIKTEGVLPPNPAPIYLMTPMDAEYTGGSEVKFISNGLLEVRPRSLKGHGVGGLVMNAMVCWALRYHHDRTVRPIATARGEPVESKLIAFYSQFGFSFGRGETEYFKASDPLPVTRLQKAPTPHLQLVSAPTLEVTK